MIFCSLLMGVVILVEFIEMIRTDLSANESTSMPKVRKVPSKNLSSRNIWPEIISLSINLIICDNIIVASMIKDRFMV